VDYLGGRRGRIGRDQFRDPESTAAGRTVGADVVGLAELLASCLARWWGLPRIRRVQPAFVLFVAGLALAEACGLIGVFLGAHRNELVVLGVLGMLQWVPLFARRYFRPSTAALPPPER